MSIERLMMTAASAMEANKIRMSTTASNLANAETLAGNADDVYKARKPVFETIRAEQAALLDGEQTAMAGIKLKQIVESNDPAIRRYEPGNPLADDEGYVFAPNVNVMTEMADMIAASRAYQANIEVMKDAREISQQLLRMGQG